MTDSSQHCPTFPRSNRSLYYCSHGKIRTNSKKPRGGLTTHGAPGQ
ncbi:unnamed protein product [Staurois parvus]|uniref:Uncharacterized protein n=1 Tax=Staurois parvus TaxID=386267 RepID=A0ABN9AGH4_9NEOB|nr:unnamed protein product [Staurois parvus]